MYRAGSCSKIWENHWINSICKEVPAGFSHRHRDNSRLCSCYIYFKNKAVVALILLIIRSLLNIFISYPCAKYSISIHSPSTSATVGNMRYSSTKHSLEIGENVPLQPIQPLTQKVRFAVTVQSEHQHTLPPQSTNSSAVQKASSTHPRLQQTQEKN